MILNIVLISVIVVLTAEMIAAFAIDYEPKRAESPFSGKRKTGGKADMKRLNELKTVVYAELVENESARRNDTALVMGVLKRIGVDTSRPFAELSERGELRQLESITRCRRKIQEEHPELKDAIVAEKRIEREEVFKEFARQSV